MKIEIISKYNSSVLFSHDVENNSILTALNFAVSKGADLEGAYLGGANLGGADLGGANLRGANLRGANLGGADLRGAYLEGAYLRGVNLEAADLEGATYGKATLSLGILQLLGLTWLVFFFDAHIKIGYQLHSTTEWTEFDDNAINNMNDGALEFWTKNKTIILSLAKQHQTKLVKQFN